MQHSCVFFSSSFAQGLEKKSVPSHLALCLRLILRAVRRTADTPVSAQTVALSVAAAPHGSGPPPRPHLPAPCVYPGCPVCCSLRSRAA